MEQRSRTYEKKYLFVVGSQWEARTIEELGEKARSIHDADMAQLALELAAEERTAIIILNDETSKLFADACTQAGAAHRITSDPEQYKKVLSWYPSNKLEFKTFLDYEASAAIQQAEYDREEAYRKQLAGMGVHDVFDVALEIANGQADRRRIPTGLKALDDALDGGLPAGGLTTIGATSSTGKTTLCLQVADSAAARGWPVLFVTVEQGRHELVSKSISRMMRQQPTRNGSYHVISGADILCKEKREEWDALTWDAFNRACADYSEHIAPNMHIMELDKQPTTADIRKAAEAIGGHRWAPPFVVVDYLQLLAPANERMTERQAVDHNVMDLRHLARDLNTCVVCISSLNRASYSEGVTMEAFKESGAVEYSSDILLGMQPRGFEDKVNKAPETQRKREARQVERAFKGNGIREAEIKVLKNRGGKTPKENIPLTFEAACSLFTTDESAMKNTDDKPRLRL